MPPGNDTQDSQQGKSEATSLSLLEQARALQPEAWQRLVKLYGPLIFSWCRQSGLSPDDAADVVQEVFRSVVKDLCTFRGGQPRGSFRAWLRAITRHRVVDLYRQRRDSPDAEGGTLAQHALLEVPDGQDLSCTDTPEAEGALWRRALGIVQAEFEPRTWDAFFQVVVEGRGPEEVAERLQMTLQGVYKAKSRVLQRLRQRLGEFEAGT